MPTGKASGPDVLTVKADVMDFIWAFFNDGTIIESLNRAAVTLIPKKTNPERVFDYRPISVINTIATVQWINKR